MKKYSLVFEYSEIGLFSIEKIIGLFSIKKINNHSHLFELIN